MPQETISWAKLPPHLELCCILHLPSLKWFYGIQNHDNHYALKLPSNIVFVWKKKELIHLFRIFSSSFLYFKSWATDIRMQFLPLFFFSKSSCPNKLYILGLVNSYLSEVSKCSLWPFVGMRPTAMIYVMRYMVKGFSWDMWYWDFRGYGGISVDMMSCWGGDRLAGRSQTACFTADGQVEEVDTNVSQFHSILVQDPQSLQSFFVNLDILHLHINCLPLPFTMAVTEYLTILSPLLIPKV